MSNSPYKPSPQASPDLNYQLPFNPSSSNVLKNSQTSLEGLSHNTIPPYSNSGTTPITRSSTAPFSGSMSYTSYPSIQSYYNTTPTTVASPSLLGFHRRPSQSSVDTMGTVTSTIGTSNITSGVAAKHPDLPALITTREVNETVNSYNNLLSAAQKYRQALLQVSEAAADFGGALEDSARCKGAGSSAEALLNAGGLHYLVSNHQQILANTIQRSFEQPVRKQVHQLRKATAKNEEEFRAALKAKTKALRVHEADNIRLSKKRVRNLAAYRSSLLELTSQIDDIDRLKYNHFVQQFDLAQSTSFNILSYAAAVVRAEVEIYEGIARKGWSGGGLDDLISNCIDPFALSEDEDDEQEVDLYPSPKQGFFSTVSQFGNTSNSNNSSPQQTTHPKPKKDFDVTRKISSAFQNVASFTSFKDKGKKEPEVKQKTQPEEAEPESNANKKLDVTNKNDTIASFSNPNTNDYSSLSPASPSTFTFASSNQPPNIPTYNSPWYSASTTGLDDTNVTGMSSGSNNPHQATTHHPNSSSGDSSYGSAFDATLHALNLNQPKSPDVSKILGFTNGMSSSSLSGSISSVIKSSHVKQSSGKGIFSLLPPTSILPRHGPAGLEPSDEDDEENATGNRRRTLSMDFKRKASLNSIDTGSIDYSNDEADEENGGHNDHSVENKDDSFDEANTSSSQSDQLDVKKNNKEKEEDNSKDTDSKTLSQVSHSGSESYLKDPKSGSNTSSIATARSDDGNDNENKTADRNTANSFSAVGSDSEDSMLGYSGWRNVRSLSQNVSPIPATATASTRSTYRTVSQDSEPNTPKGVTLKIDQVNDSNNDDEEEKTDTTNTDNDQDHKQEETN